MRYAGMPAGMWALFRRSFKRELRDTLGYGAASARSITRAAHARYKQIIAGLPDFERGDRFQMNIVSCAMLSAFLLNMEPRPSVDDAALYYGRAMMTAPMQLFCRLSARRKFSERDLADMRATERLRAADRNPYSWNMELLPYDDGSGYEARFSHCGICTLMAELGLSDLVPAMCRLDYIMSDAGGRSVFVREHTLAEGGPYCDCGYKRK